MKKDLLKRIGKYSIAYGIVMLIIILLFSAYNKSFVWVNVSYDGLDQHLVNLQLLKNFLLGNHNCFFWNVGYGMDLFANFTYYIFGDFPSFISVLFSDSKLDIAYELIVMIRVYLVGIAFLIYTSDKKYSDETTVIGSILYTFSTFLFFSMARHPYFLNSMIIFPIFLLSVEKFILKDKKIFFILMVAILFISSFYYGYMLSIIAMIYGIVLLYKNNKQKKEIVKKVFLAIIYAVVGVLMASVVLFPTFEAFISSPRSGGSLFFYSIEYYSKLPAALISTNDTGNWSIFGISSIVLITLPLFLHDKKRNSVLYLMLIILFIPVIIPLAGSIFDCLSFPNNRWIFVLTFVLSLITMEVIEKKQTVDIKKYLKYIIGYLLVIFILRFKISVQEIVAGGFAITFLYMIANNKKKYLLVTILVSVIFNFYFMYDSHFGGYINEFVSRDTTKLYKNNNENTPYLTEAIEFIKNYDHEFYNIMVYPNILNNLGLINNYNSTSYFYSIVSKNYYNLAKELENQQMQMNEEIKTFNQRTKINELLNNRYLITTNKDYHPYGYEVIKSFNNKTYVLENKASTSFAHLYTKSISKEDYDGLSPLQKEDVLLKYQISDKTDYLELANIKSIPYSSNISLENKKVTIKGKTNDEILLDFNGVENSELYLSITNLHRENDLITTFDRNNHNVNVCLNDLCFSEWEDSKYLTAYHIDNSHILVNLGYYDNISGTVKVIFNANGTYTFDNIEILAVDFSDYEKTVNDLNVKLTNLKEEDNSLSFDADIKETGTLEFTTNYNKYFDIYVDGVKVKSKIVNKYFLGCDITKGVHHIDLVYHNTLIGKSFYISLLGIFAFFVIIIVEKKKRCRYEKG